MDPALRHGPHVFVEDLDAPELDDDDRHHLERVLRTKVGAELTVCDGAGRWRTARFGAAVEPVGEVVHEARLTPQVRLAVTPVKGDRPEWVVAKATELGVDEIVLVTSQRSVVRWTGVRAQRHLQRLRRVGREAAMQSRRTYLPQVRGVLPLASLASEPGWALAEPAGSAPLNASAGLVIGPEGGWSDGERDEWPTQVSLGSTILRSETAAVFAGALLVSLRSGLVGPPLDP